MKNKKLPIEKIIERGKIDTPYKQMHGGSLSLFCTGTSIKSGGAKLNVCGQDSSLSDNAIFFSRRVKRHSPHI